MKTAELKAGDLVMLRNGWKAEVLDNKRGTVRMCKVYGIFTETGSVYAHDIVAKIDSKGNVVEKVEHTEKENQLRAVSYRY